MDGSFLAVLFAVLISAFGIENGIFLGVVLLFLYYPLRYAYSFSLVSSLLKRMRCDVFRHCLMMMMCFLKTKLRRRRQGKHHPKTDLYIPPLVLTFVFYRRWKYHTTRNTFKERFWWTKPSSSFDSSNGERWKRYPRGWCSSTLKSGGIIKHIIVGAHRKRKRKSTRFWWTTRRWKPFKRTRCACSIYRTIRDG